MATSTMATNHGTAAPCSFGGWCSHIGAMVLSTIDKQRVIVNNVPCCLLPLSLVDTGYCYPLPP
jgi:hypothetical protein